jgi:hypothetical protein
MVKDVRHVARTEALFCPSCRAPHRQLSGGWYAGESLDLAAIPRPESSGMSPAMRSSTSPCSSDIRTRQQARLPLWSPERSLPTAEED